MEEENEKLLKACEEGDGMLVQELIASGRVDVNAKNNCERTPLFLAMKFNHPEIVRILLADPITILGTVDEWNDTGLDEACRLNYEECVQLYVHDERFNRDRPEEYKTALTFALQKGHEELAKFLLAIPNIDVNYCIRKKYTPDYYPLDIAIKRGLKDVVSLLLENEATNLDNTLINVMQSTSDSEVNVECVRMLLENERYNKNLINAQNEDGFSPLYCAMKLGNLGIVQLLLSYPETSLENAGLNVGISYNFQECVKCFINHSRCTLEIIKAYEPLHCAVGANDEGMIELILNIPDLDPNTTDSSGSTPLLSAMAADRASAVKILLKNDKVKADVVDNDGVNPIFAAVYRNRTAALVSFVENEKCTADIVNSKNTEGKTALYLANETGNLDIVKALLKHPGIDLNFEDYGGKCPIFWGMIKDDEELVKLSLRGKFGFDITDSRSDGKTPLMCGCYRNSIKSVMMLMNDPRCTKAVLNQKDDDGRSALMYAVHKSHLRIALLLITHPDIDINTVSQRGLTPLMAAMMNEADEDDDNDISLMVKLLLAHPDIKLDVLIGNMNCLHFACYRRFKGRNQCVKAFINDRRCTPDIINKVVSRNSDDSDDESEGSMDITPLMAAVMNKDSELVRIFTENPKVDCNTGNPLKYAVDNQLEQIVELLISNPTVKFEFSETFEDSGIIKACATGNQTIIDYLVNDKHERLTNDILSLKNGLGYTALMTAVMYGNAGITKAIVGKFGWQEDVRNKNGQNALDLAKKYRPEMAN